MQAYNLTSFSLGNDMNLKAGLGANSLNVFIHCTDRDVGRSSLGWVLSPVYSLHLHQH